MAQVVMIVHGVGNAATAPQNSERDAWAKDVERVLLDAAAAYPGIDTSQLVLEPILYDDIFQRYALTWEKLAQKLEHTPLQNLTSFMRNAADDGFLWGSVGDVIQYRALDTVRQNVLTAVASQIATVVAKHGTVHNYSVLAHSLGTAVAHDAISALATRAVQGNTVMYPPNFRFSNFFALANVSKLVWATTDDFYQTTCVRPFDSGLQHDRCTVNYYATFRHVADPIASLVRFAPRGWSPQRFQQTDVRHYRDLDVHAFVHYLASPQVSDRVLTRLFPGAVTPELRAARFHSFADYLDPQQQAKKLAIDSVEALLDRLSGQAKGKLELDIDALVRALWQSRALLREKLAP
ncbi:MAG: hypothetical protein JWN04_6483 [Myxococcaceae bacterium]|nr:hypothetical protein [Myxococcaceae bacterium]